MKKEVEYPANHKAAMRVPKGGSCCQNCKYWTGKSCTNKYYIKYNGNGQIPAPADEYCSDFYEPSTNNE